MERLIVWPEPSYELRFGEYTTADTSSALPGTINGAAETVVEKTHTFIAQHLDRQSEKEKELVHGVISSCEVLENSAFLHFKINWKHFCGKKNKIYVRLPTLNSF